MKLNWTWSFFIISVTALLFPAVLKAQQSEYVHDNAQIFSADAVSQANDDIAQMKQKHGKELFVETFSAVPDKDKDAAKDSSYFKKWAGANAAALKANGVYVLICMDPHKLQVEAGKNTIARGDFTQADIEALRTQIQAALRTKDYDKALTGAVDSVERAYSENIREPVNRGNTYGNSYNSSPRYIPPVYNPPANSPHSSDTAAGLTFGSLVCLIIGGIIIVSLVRSIFRGGSSGGFGGFGNSYGGGYVPPNQGNYGGGYGGYGNSGGGFGKGLLGGLLGGALGGWAENRFEGRNQQTGFFGGNQNDNSGNYGGGGGGGGGVSSYDSGPSDAGQGFSDNSAGGDFGSSGGGDSGGGGGDSGGGSSGGDF